MLAATDHETALGRSADPSDVVRLATWLSPSFPIGAFSYSHGLETAIVAGTVKDVASLQEWLGAVVERGSGWCDAVLFAEAWRATSSSDFDRLERVSDLALALAPSAERLIETRNLGAAFLEAITAGWPHTLIHRLQAMNANPAQPVAVGVATAAHNIALDLSLAMYLNSFAGNLISVAVRLVPLGQAAGLLALSQLHPKILAAAERAAASTLDDLGSSAILSDIASMRHETLYSRVFRS